jgi:hypothetical protein
MERTLPFLIVEFPSQDFVMTRFTRAHTLCAIDLVSQRPVVRGGGRAYPTVFQAKGVAWREFQGLLEELSRVHGPPEVLRRDLAGLAWLCRVDMHTTHLGGDAQALAQFEDRFGPPWLHVEQGVLHLRARLAEGIQPERLIDQLRGFLAATGAQAQVEVRDLAPHDYGVWEELLQASAGRAAPRANEADA